MIYYSIRIDILYLYDFNKLTAYVIEAARSSYSLHIVEHWDAIFADFVAVPHFG